MWIPYSAISFCRWLSDTCDPNRRPVRSRRRARQPNITGSPGRRIVRRPLPGNEQNQTNRHDVKSFPFFPAGVPISSAGQKNAERLAAKSRSRATERRWPRTACSRRRRQHPPRHDRIRSDGIPGAAWRSSPSWRWWEAPSLAPGTGAVFSRCLTWPGTQRRWSYVVLAGGRKHDSLACAQGHGPAHRSIRPRGEIDGSKGPIVTVVSSSGPTGIAL